MKEQDAAVSYDNNRYNIRFNSNYNVIAVILEGVCYALLTNDHVVQW